jgi:hypothetical protein
MMAALRGTKRKNFHCDKAMLTSPAAGFACTFLPSRQSHGFHEQKETISYCLTYVVYMRKYYYDEIYRHQGFEIF